MKLYSAAEDFEIKTLAAVPGLLGKLRYVAALRATDGTYVHWGLQRVYGTSVAQRAITEVHRSLLAQALRTPIRDLFKDAGVSAASAQLSRSELLQELEASGRELTPAEFLGGTSHFSTVLQALSLLERSCTDANLRVS